MKTKCPHCGEEYEVEADALGQTAECATCGGEFQVRDAEAEVEAESKIQAAHPSLAAALSQSDREAASSPSSSEIPPAETKKCPFCFMEVPSGARKCASCGEWLPGEEPTAKTPENCPFCQSKLTPGAKKCASCGEWLPGSKPKDPIPYIILLIFFGNFGVHNFYAKQPLQGIFKIAISLLTLLFLAYGDEVIVVTLILLLANAVWCIIDLCRYKEILSAAGKS